MIREPTTRVGAKRDDVSIPEDLALKHIPQKGPYIKDVRTGRGKGGSPKEDIAKEVAWN